MQPLARRDHLVVEEIWDEVVVYDQQDNQVHRLNPSAACVWRHCNGERSVADLAAVLQTQLGLPLDDNLAQLALDELSEANLLTEPIAVPAGAIISRRELLERLAVAAYMVPLVASVLAVPSTAAASTLTGPSNGGATIFPLGGTFSGSLVRGSGSCNGDYAATAAIGCTLSSNLQTCTITETGQLSRTCTGSAPVSGSAPTATYSGTGIVFQQGSSTFSGSWTVTCAWTANSSFNITDSRTITGSGGCPATYTGVCH